jgi:hypothetical protein
VRRLIIPPEISRRLGSLLSREGIVRLLTGLHTELPRFYGQYRRLRHPDDDRLCLYFEVLADGDRMHRFTYFVDDSTADVCLTIAGFEYDWRRLGP